MEIVPDLRTRSELLASGVTDAEVRRLRRRGEVTTLRRGAYCSATDERLRDPDARHVLRVRATLPALAEGSVVSHISAAALHGLPTWNVDRDRVHVTRDAAGGGRRSPTLHVHIAPLAPDDVVTVDGMAVTSVARTVVDIARDLPFEEAVVIADAALAAGLETALPAAALERAGRWRGTPAARRVLAFADGGGQSVGESRSRVAIARAGLPAPVLQWTVVGPDGRFVARTDFAWPDRGVVGEFDGRVKYGRLSRPGQEAADVVHDEKLREDAIRAQDLAVVRWYWADLAEFARTAARLDL